MRVYNCRSMCMYCNVTGNKNAAFIFWETLPMYVRNMDSEIVLSGEQHTKSYIRAPLLKVAPKFL